MYRSLENNLVPGFHYYDYYESVYLSFLVLPESFGGLFICDFSLSNWKCFTCNKSAVSNQNKYSRKKTQKNNAAFLIVNNQLWTLFVRCLYRVLDNWSLINKNYRRLENNKSSLRHFPQSSWVGSRVTPSAAHHGSCHRFHQQMMLRVVLVKMWVSIHGVWPLPGEHCRQPAWGHTKFGNVSFFVSLKEELLLHFPPTKACSWNLKCRDVPHGSWWALAPFHTCCARSSQARGFLKSHGDIWEMPCHCMR